MSPYAVIKKLVVLMIAGVILLYTASHARDRSDTAAIIASQVLKTWKKEG